MPEPSRPPPLDAGLEIAFAAKRLSTHLNNFLPLRHRDVDGLIATAKNSGTHWLRFMLSCAMAAQYGLPPPARSSGERSGDFIASPKWKPVHPQIPRIVSSHTVPSGVLAWPWVRRAAGLPRTLVLVREIGEAMLSNYVKWQDDYRSSLAQFVRGDPLGRRYTADAWWFVRFFNRWGDAAARFPDEILVLRYEDIGADPAAAVDRAGRHFGIAFTPAALDAAVAVSSRGAVAEQLDRTFEEVIIPDAERRRAARFSAGEAALLQAILSRHLRHDFGYGYLAAPDRLGRPVVRTAPAE